MQEVFENIIEKLKEVGELKISIHGGRCNGKTLLLGYSKGIENAIEIVKQEAEQYNNGWIPCSERMPEEAFGCFVTVMDYNQATETEFENILPYVVGYDGNGWNDIDGETIPFEVIAWMPLPEPYKEGEKHE